MFYAKMIALRKFDTGETMESFKDISENENTNAKTIAWCFYVEFHIIRFFTDFMVS